MDNDEHHNGYHIQCKKFDALFHLCSSMQTSNKLFLTCVFFFITKLFSDLVIEKIKRPMNYYAVLVLSLQRSKF
jgi:hypothetical protein